MADRALLRSVGEALYGPRWQSSLARELGVADRTVRRWIAGEDEPRSTVWAQLLALAEQRHGALGAALGELREAAGGR